VFSAEDGVNGLKLWKTDGTESGTTLLKNIEPYLFSAKVFNGYLYFYGFDGITKSFLWKTDGTLAGTTLVAPNFVGSSLNNFTVFNGNLFFTADTESTGIELWSCGAVSSSISNVELKNNYKIFPNPTTGIVTISSTQAIASIDVFDVTGKLVYSQQNNNNQTSTSLNLSNLSNGIYFIHAKTETGVVSKSKVVVSK
jgi:ELWxxDGT repeat protein